jgi:hypothetical protein
MRAFAEIITDFTKPEIKRMDSVLAYLQSRGRAKDESPWIEPFLVEEIKNKNKLAENWISYNQRLLVNS